MVLEFSSEAAEDLEDETEEEGEGKEGKEKENKRRIPGALGLEVRVKGAPGI